MALFYTLKTFKKCIDNLNIPRDYPEQNYVAVMVAAVVVCHHNPIYHKLNRNCHCLDQTHFDY